jgi:hypothetical protein
MEHRESGLGEAGEVSTRAVVVEPVATAPVGRRDLAALVGALAGLAAVGCVSAQGEEPSVDLGRSLEALASGTALAWVETVLGAVPPNARVGDLAIKNSANLNNAMVVFAMGCVTAGDGGGGLFYWDTSSTPDNGGTIIRPTAGGGCWKRIFTGAMSVLWFGVKGDGTAASGTTGDQDAVVKALAAASAAPRHPLSGASRTYGVTGNITLPENIQLQDAAFRQLGPNAGGVRTLTSNGGNNIKLVRVRVDRNGNGNNGEVGIDAGIWIDGGVGHYFEDVEVHGNDMGSGLVIQGANKFDLVRPYVHDMGYSWASQIDDQVQGIWIINSSMFRLLAPKVCDLGGLINGTLTTTRFSRGIVFGACSSFTMSDHLVEDVDQGVDLTGGPGGNAKFAITGGQAIDCRSWGHKFANTARDGTVTGCVALRCGFAGFVASGPSDANPDWVTSDITFVGCTAYDTGSNGAWSDNNVAGFRVMNGRENQNSTLGIRFIGCKAHDRVGAGGNMKFGFHNQIQVSSGGDLVSYNECVDCVSIGHTIAPFEGMHEGHCEVWLSANQSIETNQWTSVEWSVDADRGGMHSLSANIDTITTRRPGTYSFHFGVEFVHNVNGVRGIRVTENGNAFRGSTVIVDATVSSVTALNVSFSRKCNVPTNYKLEVLQESEGDLEITTATGGVVTLVS